MGTGSLHVGFLLYGGLDRLTGGTLYDRMLVRHLEERGDRVSVVTLPERHYGRALLDNLSSSLARQLDEPFDVLVQDELVHPSVFRRNHRLDVPVVGIVHLLRVSQHWPGYARPLYRFVERRYLASVDGLVCVNRPILQRITGLLGRQPNAIVAHPAGDHAAGGIDRTTIRRRALADGPLRILFVGNLSPLKNLDLVLDALGQIGRDDWRLDVYGGTEVDPAYAGRIRRQIERLELAERVVLHGLRPHEVIVEAMRDAHVLAMPSAPESYSIAYLEAMSWGLPVIANTASDSAALVEPGRNGYHVRPGEADRLAVDLGRLCADRSHLGEMGFAARAFFDTHPTWAESMERIRAFLLAHARSSR